MTNNSAQLEPKIGSLDQFQFVLFASKDTRLTACDLAVLIEIADRYLKKDGHTRATGNKHLERETGRSDGAVQSSRRRLVEFGYLSVGRPGEGTRGTEYLPNFDWSQAVANVVINEIRSRANAKKYRRPKSSGAVDSPTNVIELVGQSGAPLRGLVWQPDAPLATLVGLSHTPQTYVGPTSPLRRGANAPTLGLAPASGVAPPRKTKLVTVSAARLKIADGETALVLDLQSAEDAEDTISIVVESSSDESQWEGQRYIEDLSRAVGIDINAPDDLLQRSFVLTASGRFLPAPANENDGEAAA